MKRKTLNSIQAARRNSVLNGSTKYGSMGVLQRRKFITWAFGSGIEPRMEQDRLAHWEYRIQVGDEDYKISKTEYEYYFELKEAADAKV